MPDRTPKHDLASGAVGPRRLPAETTSALKPIERRGSLLSITSRPEGRVSVVVPVGEIDAGTAPLLRSSLLDQFASGASDVVVDLSLVDFLDSTGLGVLLGAKRRAKLVRG